MPRFASLLAKPVRPLAAVMLLPLLAGCKMVVLDPAGDVARQQGNLVIASTALMLLIILPVMALTVLFAWRYRARNTAATYKPDWDHSTQLELVIWAAPLLIIICLGALTWVGTHLLDPYRSLARTAPGQPVTARTERPLEVEVVALDWKWLFIYPEQGIATVNQLAAPVGRPIRFRISASSVMNSFYVPALAGQIYAMPGMETRLHGVFDRTGDFEGFSANYSGAGFSHMRFRALSMPPADFDAWVRRARAGADTLDRAAYLKLERPSEKEPARLFSHVEPMLFDRIVNMCAAPGKMCMHDMMAIDARGGMGTAGLYNLRSLGDDRTGTAKVAAACTAPLASGDRASPRPVSMAPLVGAGLSRPATASPAPAALLTALNGPVHPTPAS